MRSKRKLESEAGIASNQTKISKNSNPNIQSLEMGSNSGKFENLIRAETDELFLTALKKSIESEREAFDALDAGKKWILFSDYVLSLLGVTSIISGKCVVLYCLVNNSLLERLIRTRATVKIDYLVREIAELKKNDLMKNKKSDQVYLIEKNGQLPNNLYYYGLLPIFVAMLYSSVSDNDIRFFFEIFLLEVSAWDKYFTAFAPLKDCITETKIYFEDVILNPFIVKAKNKNLILTCQQILLQRLDLLFQLIPQYVPLNLVELTENNLKMPPGDQIAANNVELIKKYSAHPHFVRKMQSLSLANDQNFRKLCNFMQWIFLNNEHLRFELTQFEPKFLALVGMIDPYKIVCSKTPEMPCLSAEDISELIDRKTYISDYVAKSEHSSQLSGIYDLIIEAWFNHSQISNYLKAQDLLTLLSKLESKKNTRSFPCLKINFSDSAKELIEKLVKESLSDFEKFLDLKPALTFGVFQQEVSIVDLILKDSLLQIITKTVLTQSRCATEIAHSIIMNIICYYCKSDLFYDARNVRVLEFEQRVNAELLIVSQVLELKPIWFTQLLFMVYFYGINFQNSRIVTPDEGKQVAYIALKLISKFSDLLSSVVTFTDLHNKNSIVNVNPNIAMYILESLFKRKNPDSIDDHLINFIIQLVKDKKISIYSDNQPFQDGQPIDASKPNLFALSQKALGEGELWAAKFRPLVAALKETYPISSKQNQVRFFQANTPIVPIQLDNKSYDTNELSLKRAASKNVLNYLRKFVQLPINIEPILSESRSYVIEKVINELLKIDEIAKQFSTRRHLELLLTTKEFVYDLVLNLNGAYSDEKIRKIGSLKALYWINNVIFNPMFIKDNSKYSLREALAMTWLAIKKLSKNDDIKDIFVLTLIEIQAIYEDPQLEVDNSNLGLSRDGRALLLLLIETFCRGAIPELKLESESNSSNICISLMP